MRNRLHDGFLLPKLNILPNTVIKKDAKQVMQRGMTERIDVENPVPGERPGQINYQGQ